MFQTFPKKRAEISGERRARKAGLFLRALEAFKLNRNVIDPDAILPIPCLFFWAP